MGTILETIDHLIGKYDRPDFDPSDSAADGVTVGDVMLREMRDALRRVSKRVCRTCEGAGLVANPHARYSMDYVEGRPTGVYSTNDDEEIDCPDCGGVGFIRREPASLPPRPPMDEEIAF